MDGEELGGTFVISVDELGVNGLWSTIKDLVEGCMPLHGITLPNKIGKPVAVPKLPLMFVLSTDKRLLRLKQYSHSPVTWFRNPHTHLVLVSTADLHEYKSTLRTQLKRVTADIEKDWGGAAVGSEWLILYVRPFELELGDKSARKVFEKLCDDFASKRRERVVRLDIPLQAFGGPAAAGAGSRIGGGSGTSGGLGPGAGVQQGSGPAGGGLSGAAGLDELLAGMRDSIRAAFEARQAAYDAEVRRLLNERRDPKWSFTTLYLVKDSFALMLEGAGLWEDAFQEYVELETVYLDTLEAQAAATAAAATSPAEVVAAAVRDAADFGLTGSDSEDVASLLSSSWRAMRRLVLWKKSVQEFHFRQYLFAAQARVLLRLGRPIDVAERGLVFVQNFLAILAAREAAGLVKPWFKECWAFSACMSLITAITSYTAHKQALPADWDVADLLASGGGPSGPAAQAAMRQLTAALAAEKAAAASGGGIGVDGRGSRRSTDADRGRSRGVTTPAAQSASPPGSVPSAAAMTPVLAATDWELDAANNTTKVVGGISSSTSGGVSGSNSAAAAEVVDEYDDVPPLDLGVLCGQSITPGNAGLLFQGGEQRRELMDKLYCCLLGHLYHLARGELLRLGSAMRLPEAAAAAKGSASILQLGKTAFAPASKASATAAASSPVRSAGGGAAQGGDTGSTAAAEAGSTTGKGGTAAAKKKAAGTLGGTGVDVLAEAAAAGTLSPRMVAQLQELLLMPLCGFSQMITKYADGSGSGLTYEVHTPKLGLDEDPLAAALARVDSQSTPNYLSPFNSIPNSSSSSTVTSSPIAITAATGGTGSSMFDRLRRVGSSGGSSNSSSGTTAAAAPAAAGGVVSNHSHQAVAPGQSRLRKVTGDSDDVNEDEAAAGMTNGGTASDTLKRQDSCTSMATVNIGVAGDGAAGNVGAADAAGAQEVAVDSGSSRTAGAAAAVVRAAGDAGTVADSVSSTAVPDGAEAALPAFGSPQTLLSVAPASSAPVPAALGSGLKDLSLGLGFGPPKVATHTRSVSALPAAGGAGTAGATGGLGGGLGAVKPGGLSSSGVLSPRRLEGLVDPGAIAAAGQAPSTGRSTASGLSVAQPVAAASAAASVPSWVGEWRLQLALRNAACFEELLLALSRRAAWCYARAGRLRSSALIYADVAVLALQRGQLEHAARLLDRMQQIFMSEGWQLLLGALLPKLLAVQRLAAQPLLPFTAVAVLALPPGAAAAADRQAAFEELMTALGAGPADASLGLAAAATAMNPSPGASPRLMNSSFGAWGGSLSHHYHCHHAEQQLMQLGTLSAIQVRPAPGSYSHFYGSEAVELAVDPAAAAAAGGGGQQNQQWLQQQHQQHVLCPLLSPPAKRPAKATNSSIANAISSSAGAAAAVAAAAAAAVAAQAAGQESVGGAALLAVGDSLSLAVDVVSRLPGPVLLWRLVLSLVQLHKASWFSSSGGPSIFSNPAAGGLGGVGLGASGGTGSMGGTGSTGKQQPLGISLLKGGVRPGSIQPEAADSPKIAVHKWQEGEELLGTKIVAAFSPGGPGDPTNSSSSSSSALAGPDGTTAVAEAGSSSCYCQLLPDGSLVLAPGVNRLVFQLSPVREGLYCLKQLRALVGTSGELLIRVPPPGSLSLLAAAAGMRPQQQQQQQQQLLGSAAAAVVPAELPVPPGHSGTGAAAEAVQLGGVTGAGTVVSEVVVARVFGPTPRIQLSPVVPDGCLPVSCTAWLGVLLSPLHDDVLRRPRLHIQPNQLISLATAVAPGVLVGWGLTGQGLGLSSGLSSDSVGPDQQQQQQQVGLSGLSANSTASSTGLQGQQQAGNWVYVVPLQQQQQQQQQQEPAVAAAAAAAGRWLPVSRGCVDLSDVVASGLSGPLLVWMQVLVGSPAAPPPTVKVATYSATTPHPLPPPGAAAVPAAMSLSRLSSAAASGSLPQGVSSSSTQLRAAVAGSAVAAPGPPHAAAAVAAALMSKVVPDQCLLLASRPQDIAAELALQLEYTAGVWRSHSCCLQLPLQQPATIAAAALQLRNGTVALNVTVSLEPDASSSLLLLDAGLRPQYGLVLGSSSGLAGPSLAEVLPIRVLPGGSAGLCFTMAQDPGDKLTGSFEADGSSLLLLTYTLEAADTHAVIADPVTGQRLPGPPVTAATAPAAAGSEAAAATAAAAAAAAAAAETAAVTASSGSSSNSSAVMSLRLAFWMEFPSAAPAAAATLRATLLGPFSGKVGQPLTLSWQLARTGPGGSATPRCGADAGFTTVDLGSGTSSIGAAGDAAAAAADATGMTMAGQQAVGDREFDEMLCYELVPGQHSGSTGSAGPGSTGDLLRSSLQGAGALSALLQGSSSSSQAPPWWAGGSISGMVRLGRAAGSLAAVEVVVVPVAAGRHAPPQLALRSLGGNQQLLVEGGVAGALWAVDEQCVHISS